MRYVVEMRVSMTVDALGEVEPAKDKMRGWATDFGWLSPRFVTVEESRHRAQFNKPLPFQESRGVPECEHVGKSRRRGANSRPSE